MNGYHLWGRNEAPLSVREAAAVYEERFGIRFAVIVQFTGDCLHGLHDHSQSGEPDLRDLVVASERDPEIIGEISKLTALANTAAITAEGRREYLRSLQVVYGRLPRSPMASVTASGALVVAPEREGRMLAESLGWLPASAWHPHAKRIPFESGLLVGIEAAPTRRARSIVMIDGAIASGATILALLALLLPDARSLDVFSVHSTWGGIRAIYRFCAIEGVKVSITVGHATEGLSKKYYAVDPKDPGTLVVGDLGDTICDLGNR